MDILYIENLNTVFKNDINKTEHRKKTLFISLLIDKECTRQFSLNYYHISYKVVAANETNILYKVLYDQLEALLR